MTREKFIEEIEARGFKPTGVKLGNISGKMYERKENRMRERVPSEAAVGRKYAWLRKGLCGDTHSFHLPLADITEDLITAVAGPRRIQLTESDNDTN